MTIRQDSATSCLPPLILQVYDNINYTPKTTSSEYRLSTCSGLRMSDLYILGNFSRYDLLQGIVAFPISRSSMAKKKYFWLLRKYDLTLLSPLKKALRSLM